MNDLLLMAVLHGRDDLPELCSSLLLLHSTVQNQVVENFTTTSVLHYQVQCFLGLDYLEKLHYVRMVEHLHYSYFAEQL